MEVNGIAHIFLTASNFELSREFYRTLLPFLGMKPVIDSDTTFYCVGGRTAVGINAPAAEHAGSAFEQNRVGLHHSAFAPASGPTSMNCTAFCVRSAWPSFARRARINGRRDIIRCCSRIPTE
jgi:catechol 2,3-dioxygenase-like lactoylglutathione lyase family enzyme